MDLLGLVKSALSALASYLELKNKAFYYDIINKSKNRQKELINEIEELRSKRTNDSNDRADILRSELINERKTLEHLSAVYSLSGKG
jgi:uncharacterized coiled-coil DUF342 family protein